MRRRFLVALAILAGAHAYIWWRLAWPLPSPWWQLSTALMLGLAPVFPVTVPLSRRLPRERARPWLLVGYLWFGLATYLLLGAIASHVADALGAGARDAAMVCGAAAIAVVVAGLVNVARGPTEDVPRAVAGRDPGLPLILLACRPRTITRAIAAGADLQLSGHTHGGQLLPYGWLARLFDPKVSGLARFGRTWLYVSDGTGYWGPPLRVGTRCEITRITLVPA